MANVSSSTGGEAFGPSSAPVMSVDARYVAFASDASNLTAGDSNRRTDIFVYDRQTGAITRMSVSSAGAQANEISTEPAISADGRHVAFRSHADNLVAGDTDRRDDVFVHDRDTDRDGILDEAGAIATVRVSVSSSGEQGNGTSNRPALSANGRFVAFTSVASNLVAEDTNSLRDVFVHDRDADGDGVFDEPGAIATTRVSVSSTGEEANASSAGDAAVSGDGRFVAFQSEASNLGPGP